MIGINHAWVINNLHLDNKFGRRNIILYINKVIGCLLQHIQRYKETSNDTCFPYIKKSIVKISLSNLIY